MASILLFTLATIAAIGAAAAVAWICRRIIAARNQPGGIDDGSGG